MTTTIRKLNQSQKIEMQKDAFDSAWRECPLSGSQNSQKFLFPDCPKYGNFCRSVLFV